ncbi:MAG: DNA polymerase III subunit delta [Planctomycetota bacterium]
MGPVCHVVWMLTHAFELLTSDRGDPPDAVGIFGADASLRRWALDAIAGDGDMTQFDGDSVRFGDLRDDLATASLFDVGEKRTIVVRSADKFVSANRPELEKFLQSPSGASRLVLELESLASNTKIYKSLHKDHLLVACGNTPDKKLGVSAASRRKFITSWIAPRHKCQLSTGAADALVEMLGEDLGMIDTEVAKLALFVEPGEKVDEELVREVTAGWKGQTVWQITDAIAGGRAAEAIQHLDRLMGSGQAPVGLLPQLAYSLRRLSMAATVFERAERMGRKIGLEDALSYAGIRYPGEIQSSKKQLQQLTRERALKLLPWLLDADLRLKGTHSADGRDRFLLEHLVMRLSRAEN